MQKQGLVMDKILLLGATKSRALREVASGPRTAVQLASTLRIQVSAARKHLERLRAMGLVDERFERAGPGRPKKFYALTEEGREMFPRRYDRVLNALLADLVRDQGEGNAERALHRVAADFARTANPEPGSGRVHLRKLASALGDLGFEPSLAVEGDEWTITSRNCPILRTAKSHRELVCRGLHAEILRRSTGVSSVQRKKWIVDGDPVCTHTFRRR